MRLKWGGEFHLAGVNRRPPKRAEKIEPGFFFSRRKSWLKPGKKTEKKPFRKCEEYSESWGSGDVVTDRGRTTPVAARGQARKKSGSILHRPPSSPTLLGRSRIELPFGKHYSDPWFGSGQEKKNKQNFLWPKMGVWDPFFDPQKSPPKSLCGSPFASFPRK